MSQDIVSKNTVNVHNMDADVLKRIQNVVHLLGINQANLARMLGINRSTISELLKGKAKKFPETYEIILKYRLGVNPEYFANGNSRIFLEYTGHLRCP